MIDANGASVQIQTDRPFELRWNVTQSIIEGLFLLAISCGLLGLFGFGWFSQTSAIVPQAGAVSYERFLRDNAPGQIELVVTSRAPDGKLRLVLNRGFLEQVSIPQTEPRASSVEADAAHVRYVFDLGAEGRGNVTLSIKPKTFGSIEADWTLNGQPVTFNQFAYP
jgi:hypothetical protein